MWLEDLGNYLRAQNVAGIGSSVFVYTLKENDVGAMLTAHTSGVLASLDIPDYYKGPLQLVVRATNPKDAEQQATAIVKVLSSTEKQKLGQAIGFTLPTIQVNYVYPRHLPVVYPRSDGNYYEASVNFDICFVAISS